MRWSRNKTIIQFSIITLLEPLVTYSIENRSNAKDSGMASIEYEEEDRSGIVNPNRNVSCVSHDSGIAHRKYSDTATYSGSSDSSNDDVGYLPKFQSEVHDSKIGVGSYISKRVMNGYSSDEESNLLADVTA